MPEKGQCKNVVYFPVEIIAIFHDGSKYDNDDYAAAAGIWLYRKTRLKSKVGLIRLFLSLVGHPIQIGNVELTEHVQP